MQQLTDTVLMVAPKEARFHQASLDDNSFQNEDGKAQGDYSETVRKELHLVRDALTEHGVQVCFVSDSSFAGPNDAIFPNNWVSTFEDGTLVLYPMCHGHRRKEREGAAFRFLEERYENVIELYQSEAESRYLEGTGSLVLDRAGQTAYAVISQRTDLSLVEEWCERFHFQPVVFHACDLNNQPVYHTNVLLSLGVNFSLVCSEAIADSERTHVLERLQARGVPLVEISLQQMGQFCGNILQLKAKTGEAVIAMSQSAMDGFSAEQRETLSGCGKIVSVDISTIERYGGGSMRCLLAEVF